MSSFGLRESKKLARRQRRLKLLKSVFILAFLAALVFVSFEIGRGRSEGELRWSQQEVARLRDANTALEKGIAELRKKAEIARVQQAELRRAYEKDVPRGDRLKMLALVDEQLAQGAKPDRLRFLIAAAGNEEKCDGAPVTKRFIVRTPIHDAGTNTAVAFADGALTVTAMGEPAEDAAGNPQAWYDPAKPLSLAVTPLGGTADRVKGTLPLQHALVVNGAEYRLTVAEGDSRGFVNVTADRCQFP